MTQDEIIEMARQAGLIVNSPYLMPHDHVLRGIESFAKLVAAKEREACAKACDGVYYKNIGPALGEVRYGIAACAKAIRARGEA